jgi:tRNA-modifying protein YgfZ
MNSDFKNFLLERMDLADDQWQAGFPDPVTGGDNAIYALDQFGVLSVSGKDAATLLQGQMTCNVNEVDEGQAKFGAICNPKGRVLATILLLRKEETFLLILPLELLEPIKSRLQMYVLRSQVKIEDSTEAFCLIGISEQESPGSAFLTWVADSTITVNIPATFKRSLLLTDAESAIRLWAEKVNSQSFRTAYANEWAYLDLMDGIPWLTKSTSEEYIPQMLNLDKLGGISFNKGCYTGQEIVARTHYLGKNKREMFLAECQFAIPPEPGTNVINSNSDNQEVVGKVLKAQQIKEKCILLIILQTSDLTFDNLYLQDNNPIHIDVIPLAYDR